MPERRPPTVRLLREHLDAEVRDGAEVLLVVRTHEHPESKLQGGGGHGQVVAGDEAAASSAACQGRAARSRLTSALVSITRPTVRRSVGRGCPRAPRRRRTPDRLRLRRAMRQEHRPASLLATP
jgi:hypothetical protein